MTSGYYHPVRRWQPPERRPREVFPGKPKERDRRAWSPPSPRQRKVRLPWMVAILAGLGLVFWVIPAAILLMKGAPMLKILIALGVLYMLVRAAEMGRSR